MLEHISGAQLQLPFVSERYTRFDPKALQQGGLLLGGFNMKDVKALPSKPGVAACAQSEQKGISGHKYAMGWRSNDYVENNDNIDIKMIQKSFFLFFRRGVT